ncbi:MAG: universal stress protein [Chitinophagaceae bacterium]|nr:MAG: universal stress protein [Chitinophagaceae bacterium]
MHANRYAMKTMLLPIDFSPTARNAADFALHWCRRYGYDRVILVRSLFHSYFEDMAASAEYMLLSQQEKGRFYEEEKEVLDSLCKELTTAAGPGIRIFTALSDQPLVRTLLQLVEQESPDLIVAGSDNQEYESDSFVSAKLIELARASPVRVLVVPAGCAYVEPRSVLVPCNLAQTDSLERLAHLAQATQGKDLQLEVLHVDTPGRGPKPANEAKALEHLHRFLKDRPYHFHRIPAPTELAGILQFAASADVQLIVALPRRHSFLYALTHKSVSEALYRNTQYPVLILK